MLGKKSLFGGFIGLFFFSIVVFFIIYFLTPEVSLKFFGITFNQEKYVEKYLENTLIAADVSEDVATEIVETDAGQQLVSFLAQNNVLSEANKTLISGAVESAKLGVSSFIDYISDQEDFT